MSFAVDKQNISEAQSSLTELNRQSTGFIPYLGAELGYTSHHPDIDVEGMPSSLKILGSYYTFNNEYVFDLGLGIMNQQFSQFDVHQNSISGTAFEIAARYRWADIGLQLGILETTFFNQGIHYNSNQADIQLAGLQLLKEWNISNNVSARWGGRFLKATNVNIEPVNMAMLELQLNWQIKDEKPANLPTHYPPTRSEIIYPNSAEKLSQRSRQELLKDNNLAYFTINSSALSFSNLRELAKLARVLKKNSDLFEKIELVGHADKVGSTDRNIKLSKERAQNVAKIFLDNGFKTEYLMISGEGSKLLEDQNLRTKNNRRVEIKFIGIKDKTKLEELIHSL